MTRDERCFAFALDPFLSISVVSELASKLSINERVSMCFLWCSIEMWRRVRERDIVATTFVLQDDFVIRLVSVVMFLIVRCCCLFLDSQIRSYFVYWLVCAGFLDDCIFL